jgi:diguanylate cyclase (GGDEF)-like protein/PAS domain S-box-containing protein
VADTTSVHPRSDAADSRRRHPAGAALADATPDPETVRRRNGGRFDRIQFRARLAIIIALATACVLVPAAGENRYALALLLVLVVLPAHFVVRRIAGVPNPTGWLDLLAVTSATAAAAIAPDIWAPALLFQMLNFGGAVAFLQPRWATAISTSALSSMTIVAIVRRVDIALPMLIVAMVFLPVMLMGSTRKKAREKRASSRMTAAVDSLPMLVWEARADSGELLSVIGRLEDLLGRSTSEVLERGIAADIHPDDQSAYAARFGPTGQVRGARELQFRYLRPDGSAVWLRDRVAWTITERGLVVRGVTFDITIARAQEIELGRHAQIVKRMAAATILVQPDEHGAHRVVQVTDPIEWGLDDTMVGRLLADALPAFAERPELIEALTDGIQAEPVRLGPWQLDDAAGDNRSVEVEVFPIPGGATALLVSDVTERQAIAELIRFQAHHDDLTGLANRVSLLDTLTTVTGSGRPAAMLLIDLNEFKEVNDTLGHLTGDEYLRVLGRRLAEIVGPERHVARLGGDEFAIVVVEPSPGEVDVLADLVLRCCREPVTLMGAAIASSASIGVALAPRDATSAEALLRCADLAMYRAKAAHAGVWHYEPSLDRTADQLTLLGDLGAALRAGEFEMYFQPIVSMATRSIVGAEALARWNHPTHGTLAPSSFLDLLTVSGLSGELAATALTQAAAALRRLPDTMSISINLTSQNVRSPELPAIFRRTLAATDVSPGRLTVEITEAQMLDTSGVVRAVIDELAELGMMISVDDFGTGYSSLTHLRSLPISELKIDRQFVQSMLVNEQDLVIVRSMIDLGHNLGLRVTAEGVEDEVIADHLTALGCDHAQGYLWGKPRPFAASGIAEMALSEN